MARVAVQEFERAVLHRQGAAAVVFGPGRHRYRRRHSALARVDLRPALLKVAGQEVLTGDGVGALASVVVRYAVTDPLSWVFAEDRCHRRRH
jgi:regulator of protease activity HflC (stomatin/prohibitin superfamily)